MSDPVIPNNGYKVARFFRMGVGLGSTQPLQNQRGDSDRVNDLVRVPCPYRVSSSMSMCVLDSRSARTESISDQFNSKLTR